jgi:uncharacterized protein
MEYKLSYYIFFSNPVDEAGSRVVYSTRTGKTVLITRTCYDFLINGMINQIPESIVKVLVDNRVVVDVNENELHTITDENIETGKEQDGILYEVIQPTAMCQLGCYYCGQKHTKDYLEEGASDKIVSRIKMKFDAGNYRGIYIGWFGAEPLMGLPQMRATYSKLREAIGNDAIKIKGKVVTNGLSLKEGIYNELAHDLKIDYIEVTLDGTQEYHDQHRYTKTGENSFDLIYNNLKKIVLSENYKNSDCKIGIRCNVDHKNVDGVIPLINLIAKDGLHEKIKSLYFTGIYSWGGNEAQKGSLSKEEIAMMQLKWEIEKIKLGYPVPLMLHSRKRNTCIATSTTSEMYDAFGNIFNCTEVSYADFYEGTSYKLGNIKQDYNKLFVDKPYNDWFQTVRDTDKYPCHSCRLLPVCGGSCPKAWNEEHPPCPPFKYNILKEIELKYILRKTPKEMLEGKLEEFVTAFTPADFKRIGS